MRCIKCGYRLDRLEDTRCPECDYHFDPSDKRTFYPDSGPPFPRDSFKAFLGLATMATVLVISSLIVVGSLPPLRTLPLFSLIIGIPIVITIVPVLRWLHQRRKFRD